MISSSRPWRTTWLAPRKWASGRGRSTTDSDMFRLEHMVEFYKLVGGGQKDAGWMREHMAQNRLAILPNVTHYDIFMSPLMASTVLEFIDGKGGAPTWAAQVAKP